MHPGSDAVPGVTSWRPHRRTPDQRKNADRLAVWASVWTAAQRSQSALLADVGSVLSPLGPSRKAVGWLICGATAAVATGGSDGFHQQRAQAARWRAFGLLSASWCLHRPGDGGKASS